MIAFVGTAASATRGSAIPAARKAVIAASALKFANCPVALQEIIPEYRSGFKLARYR